MSCSPVLEAQLDEDIVRKTESAPCSAMGGDGRALAPAAGTQSAFPAKALSVEAFCQWAGIGRTRLYQEISSQRLRAVKVGRRTLILADDARQWAAQLPALGVAPE